MLLRRLAAKPSTTSVFRQPRRPLTVMSQPPNTERVAVPSDLSALLSQTWDRALEHKSAFFYPSEIHRIADEGDSTGDAKAPSLSWSVRRCEALREKAKEKERKERAGDDGAGNKDKDSKQNPSDVFAPPYDPNLLVKELGDHTLLLNKFALIPHHALLVTREFRPQTLPPSPTTLALSLQVLDALPSKSPADTLCFFNCGPESGASQAHCHMQFVDLAQGGGVLIESLLDRIEKDGREMETIHALPLPYQHFVHLLPPAIHIAAHDEQERILGGLMMRLLDAMFQARSAAIVAEQPIPQTRGTSWNLLLTKRALHLIPRVMEEFPLNESAGGDNAEVGPLSLNALCFAGHLVTKSNEEIDAIKAYPGGIRAILAQVGVKPVSDFTVASTGTEGGGEA